ncbi:MAG TPA: nitroreductase [Cyclobacteriaceae bacterium]|nr:nitroreductase [Cyclobacteriaceae bacterium]
MAYNIEQINQLISGRRSVFPKDYTGEKVSDEIIKQMLENANWAPSHKLTEPWRFVVFTGEGLKRLAEFQGECYKKVTARDGSFREERFQGLITKPMQSSHIISVGMKRDEKKSLPEIEEIGAVFCAVENMYLTATAYNVGCYLSTGGITYFEEAKEFFGLGPDDRLLGFLNIGMPKGTIPEGKRRPVESKIRWVS